MTSRIERGKNVRENDIAPAGICQGSTRTENTPARTASSASFSRRASSTGTLRIIPGWQQAKIKKAGAFERVDPFGQEPVSRILSRLIPEGCQNADSPT